MSVQVKNTFILRKEKVLSCVYWFMCDYKVYTICCMTILLHVRIYFIIIQSDLSLIKQCSCKRIHRSKLIGLVKAQQQFTYESTYTSRICPEVYYQFRSLIMKSSQLCNRVHIACFEVHAISFSDTPYRRNTHVPALHVAPSHPATHPPSQCPVTISHASLSIQLPHVSIQFSPYVNGSQAVECTNSQSVIDLIGCGIYEQSECH